MKNANSFEATRQWWKKEQPAGLKKSAGPFEKALDELSKARSGLKPGDDGSIKALMKALDALEKAGSDVATEAKALASKIKDKKEKTDLTNTMSVMDKPLGKFIAEVRAELEQASEEGSEEEEEEEVSADKLKDPGLHVAYLKKIMPKLKRKTYSFALGLPSNDPADMRFSFHPKKGGRSLGSKLKAAIGAKKFTFGKAGTGKLAGDVTGDEETAARTLVLYLEGRKIPSLAKRIKMMLRAMKVTAFNKVKIVQDGVEIESADDSTDMTLEAVDLDEPDTEEEETEAPEAPQEPSEEERVNALKRRLVAINQGLGDLPEEAATKLKDGAKKALIVLNGGNIEGASKLIEALEQRLNGLAGSGDPSGSPEERAEQIRKELTGLAKRFKALDDPREAARLGTQAQEILSMVRAGQLGDAENALKTLANDLLQVESSGGDKPDPLIVWRGAKEITDVDLTALQNAIKAIPDRNLQRIAEYGLNGVTDENGKGRMVAMQKALMDYNSAAPGAREAAAGALRKQVLEYRTFIDSSQLITLCENNPFNIKVDIRGPMRKALDEIDQMIPG